jgi:hypothetical protein
VELLVPAANLRKVPKRKVLTATSLVEIELPGGPVVVQAVPGVTVPTVSK